MGVINASFFFAQDEGSAPSDRDTPSNFGLGAFHLERGLLRELGLLAEDGLGLASESLLLRIVTTCSLGAFRGLA